MLCSVEKIQAGATATEGTEAQRRGILVWFSGCRDRRRQTTELPLRSRRNRRDQADRMDAGGYGCRGGDWTVGWNCPRLVNWIWLPSRVSSWSRTMSIVEPRGSSASGPRVRRTAARPATAPIPAPIPAPLPSPAMAPMPAPAAVVLTTVPTSFPLSLPPVTLPSESMVSLPPESALRGAAFKSTVYRVGGF